MQWHPIRLNIAFGVVLREKGTGPEDEARAEQARVLKYKYASQNYWFFDEPIYVGSTVDLEENVLDELAAKDIYGEINLKVSKKGSNWTVDTIPDMVVYVAVMTHFSAIGSPVELPEYIWRNKSLVALTRDRNNRPYDDYLCLFRCLALHQGRAVAEIEAPARELFADWCAHVGIEPVDFYGFSLRDLPDVENFFDVNINVYEMSTWYEDALAKRYYVHYSRMRYTFLVNIK